MKKKAEQRDPTQLSCSCANETEGTAAKFRMSLPKITQNLLLKSETQSSSGNFTVSKYDSPNLTARRAKKAKRPEIYRGPLNFTEFTCRVLSVVFKSLRRKF